MGSVVNLGSAYGEIQIGTGGAEQNIQGLADKLRGIGGAMSLAITTPLVGIATAAGLATAEFEQSLNTMQVVSGATAQEMAALQQEALRLGAETAFSAGEAAQGMLELAKAGLSTEQVMAAIGGTLDLAAAGGLGVAQAAEIAANAVNTFGLEASDTTRVADILAAAANASSVEVTDMAQGMQMAGAVFASNKVPIEDLSTAIAILGNNGIKGSDAGTSLKTMLMRLTAPTKEATGVMRSLGIQVYNADGSMRAFEDIVGQLESSTSGLTDEQRNLALTTLFGADAIRAANVLIAEGSTAYAAMKNQVTEAGAAGLVADSKLKGLAGAIEYAKGSIESALITAFLPFTEATANLIRQGADLVTLFTELPEPVRNAALAFGAVMAAAGPVMLAISGIGAVLGFLLSPIGLIVVGVAALAAAWTANFGGIQEATAAAWGAVLPHLQAAWDWLQAQLPAALTTLQTAWDTTWAALQTATDTAWAAMQGSLSTALTWFQTDAPGALTTLQTTWETTWSGLQETASAVWTQLEALFGPAMTRLQEAFSQAQTDIGALGPVFGELQTALQNMWTAVQPILTAFGMLIGAVMAVAGVFGVNLLASMFERLGGIVETVVTQITNTINTIATVLSELTALVTAIVNGDWAAAWQAAENIVGALRRYFQTTINSMGRLVGIVFGAIYDAVVNTLTDVGVDAKAQIEAIKSWWTTKWTELKNNVQPVIDVVEALQTAIDDFRAWLSGVSLPNPFQAIGDAAQGVADAVNSALGGGQAQPPGKNARGTSYWRGGLSWVGENGPELVDLPRGARVYDAQTSQGMAGRTLNITVPVQNMNSQLDMVELAHRVAGVIMQYEGA